MGRGGARSAFAFAGVVAAGAALAAGELIAGLLPGAPSPIVAISNAIVDLQPPGAKDLVVAIFGTADKLALQVLIVAVALVIGAGLGLLARTRDGVAALILAGFAGLGFAASLADPGASAVLAVVAAAVEAVIGIEVLRRLTNLAATPPGVSATTDPSPPMPQWGRRRLLQAGGGLAVASLAAGAVGRILLEGRGDPVPGEVGTLPPVPRPAVLPPGAGIATADLAAAGLAPVVVPNDDFYRIDTAFIVPSVDRSTWTLTVTGMVERETTLTWDQLVQLPMVEQFVTIACVSNEVGGDLVGNAAWRGVPLRTVLDMAGVRPEADQLVGVSVDGFTAGMPVEWVMDEAREPLIAIGMNGEPLPRQHGYPARLIVPGLYGYVSATKWLTELRLTRFDQFAGFWIDKGWAQQAPILTQSRIDVPRDGASLEPGRVAVAGVAWAPDRGVQRVEVRIDGGDWLTTRLSAPISKATWVQWLHPWDATTGRHTIEVRATDGTGEIQTDQRTRPAPDGARGHHSISVNVG